MVTLVHYKNNRTDFQQTDFGDKQNNPPYKTLGEK